MNTSNSEPGSREQSPINPPKASYPNATEEIPNTDENEIPNPNEIKMMDIVEEDTKEFLNIDIDEMMPKSRFKDKSFLKLREFFEGITADLENAQKIGIPLEEVKGEFYFVWDAIQKSHENLEDLLHKDIKLSIEVADTMAKTRNLIRIAEDQPDKAAILGRRLEAAWNLVDISEAEEKRNSQRLEELEAEIVILNRNITQAANMHGRSELNELVKIRRKLTEERDSLKKEINRMRTTLTLLNERKMRQIDRKIEFQDMIKYADEEAIAQNEALMRETARKERLEKSILDTANNIDRKTSELDDMEKQMSVANSKIDELERTLRDQRVVNDVASREAEAAWAKQEKLKSDVEGQLALVERLATDALKRQTELKGKEDEIVIMRMESSRADRQKVANQKKCDGMQETLDSLESEREGIRTKIVQLEKDLEKAQRRLEGSKKEVEELDKQRTLVNRNLLRATAITGEHENLLKINSIAVSNLESELEGFKREIGGQTETIHRLERERDYYSHEATKLAHIVSSRVDFIKRLDMSIFENKKKVAELETSLKTSQQNYEAAIIEKQYYERCLRDTVMEINVAAKSIRHTKFEKNNLEYKEIDLTNFIKTEEEKRDRLVKETEFFKTEAHRMKHMAVDIQRETEALEVERSTLGSAIATAENEISKQRYYANGAESRKENYHRKLMKKELELRETWERWRTLHSMVRIGAYHYRNIMKEIIQIRQSIINLRHEQFHFKGNKDQIVSLKQEISTLENCIAKETCMVNALEDEFNRPINIHRWRVLEAVDPEAYDLVRKINIVTKRLVNHNEQIRQQNLRISDQEHIYVDIRGVSKHLPGLETPEERQYYEVLYEAKRQQLELLKHEMYANEAQTAFYRKQVAQLNERMEEVKQIYFRRKKSAICARQIGNASPSCILNAKRAQKELELERQKKFEMQQFQEEEEDEESIISTSNVPSEALPADFKEHLIAMGLIQDSKANATEIPGEEFVSYQSEEGEMEMENDTIEVPTESSTVSVDKEATEEPTETTESNVQPPESNEADEEYEE